MACHIDNGLLIGCALIVNDDFVVLGEGVHHSHGQFAGEAFLVVGGDIAEHEAVAVDLLSIPYAGVEACGTAVQVVGAVVDGQVVLLAVEGELAVADAVALATYEGGEEGLGRAHAVVNVVVSLNHVGIVAVAVGHHNSYECAAIVGDGHFHTVFVGQEEEVGGFTIDFFLEIFTLQSAERGLIVFHNSTDY